MVDKFLDSVIEIWHVQCVCQCMSCKVLHHFQYCEHCEIMKVKPCLYSQNHILNYQKYWNYIQNVFLSYLKVSSCDLSEGQQRYLCQHVESPAVQCKFSSV